MAIFSLSTARPFAADNPSPEYIVKNWSTADGLPHNTVRSVIESRDGYLWLGTAHGVARFDGLRFAIFDATNTRELVSDNIFSLYEDRQGTLWLRTRSGLARYANGRFEVLAPTSGLRPVPFGGMMEDNEGTFWIRGEETIGRLNGKSIEAVSMPPDGPHRIISMRPAAAGGLWLSASNGLWRFRGGQTELVTRSPTAELLAVGPEGQLWGLVQGRQLVTLRDHVWSQVAELPGEEFCTTLYAAPNGDVWLGSDLRNAAYQWRHGKMKTFSSAEGIEGVRVLGFVQDHDGNLWIGMNAGGLYRLRERRVQLIGREDGFESPNTTTVIEQPDGTMMVGVMGSTLHRVNNGKAQPIRVGSDGGSFEHPTALARAREGGVWAGTFFGTLPRVFDGQVVQRVGSSNGTRTLLVDREGRLWRGTRTAGIEIISGTNVTHFRTEAGLSHDNVYCFAEDREGAVWAGTEHGLNRIQAGRITVFGTTNGLGHEYISALCVDSRGTVWAGTLGGGLSGWNGTRFVTLTTREGLAHDAVDQLIEDDFGHLWLGTRVGLVRLSVAQLHDFIAGKVPGVTGTLVGRDEGLLRPNLWTEYQPASAKTRDGRLWFCTGSGVAVLDPGRFEKPAAAPIVHIEELRVDGRKQVVQPRAESGFSIPPGGERVEILYTAISPSEPAQVRFRYQLAGYDRDWVEAGRSRVAHYSHLPPGGYQFRVIAVNNDGVWNHTGATLSLNVRPRFWQTTWFRACSLIGCVGLGPAFYFWRVRRLERRRAAQEAFARKLIDSQEQERKRIAAELHDSLGQNLLVIKNRAALALTQMDQPEKVVAQVTEVSTVASAAIREVREIAQNLRPFQLDELGLAKSIVAMARKLAESSGIEFRAELDGLEGAVPSGHEIHLYRVVQECLSNVVKHSRATVATIQAHREGRTLQVVIRDNGRGFHASRPEADLTRGAGLGNITERVRTMGGSVSFQAHPGSGTTVELVLPVN